MPEKLSYDGLIELLHGLERGGRSGEAHFKTELGPAAVWFRGGAITDAVMGHARGRAALFRLLGLSDVRCEIAFKPIDYAGTISETVDELLDARSERTRAWRELMEQVPPLDSVLALNHEALARAQGNLAESELELLRFVDQRRTIVELVDESGLDAVAILERIVTYFELGILRTVDTPQSRPPWNAGVIEHTDHTPPDDSVRAEPVGAPAVHSPLGEARVHSPAPSSRRKLTEPIVPGGVHPPRPVTLSGIPVRIPPMPVVPIQSIGLETPAPAEPASEFGILPPPFTDEESGVLAKRETLDQPRAPGAIDGRWQGVAAQAGLLGAAREEAGPRLLLGRYEMLCRIGRGGMGTVYLCRITGEGGFRRLFAVKALRPDLSKDPTYTRLFMQEARIAARLSHPNVVSIFDVGIHGGDQPYLVMDYVDGCSLADLLERNPGPRSARLVVPIILDALNGLHAAHELSDDDGTPLDLVHCDVSPQNLLVGADGMCRVADFGVARAHGARAETMRGKPAFVSPEQITSDSVDRRSDLFSLGVVLWHALTGEQLFKGASAEATMSNVIQRTVEAPSRVGFEPPACLDAVVLKALERDPEHRFQTASEMLGMLRDVAMKNDLLAPPGEIAAWVHETFGRDLELRRLAALDGSLRARLSRPPPSGVGHPLPNEVHAPPDAAADGEALAPSSRTGTVVISRSKRRNSVLVGAAVISLIALIMSVLWPNAIGRFFKVDTTGLGGGGPR